MPNIWKICFVMKELGIEYDTKFLELVRFILSSTRSDIRNIASPRMSKSNLLMLTTILMDA